MEPIKKDLPKLLKSLQARLSATKRTVQQIMPVNRENVEIASIASTALALFPKNRRLGDGKVRNDILGIAPAFDLKENDRNDLRPQALELANPPFRP